MYGKIIIQEHAVTEGRNTVEKGTLDRYAPRWDVSFQFLRGEELTMEMLSFCINMKFCFELKIALEFTKCFSERHSNKTYNEPPEAQHQRFMSLVAYKQQKHITTTVYTNLSKEFSV